jgi:hypothetical protein
MIAESGCRKPAPGQAAVVAVGSHLAIARRLNSESLLAVLAAILIVVAVLRLALAVLILRLLRRLGCEHGLKLLLQLSQVHTSVDLHNFKRRIRPSGHVERLNNLGDVVQQAFGRRDDQDIRCFVDADRQQTLKLDRLFLVLSVFTSSSINIGVTSLGGPVLAC